MDLSYARIFAANRGCSKREEGNKGGGGKDDWGTNGVFFFFPFDFNAE